MHPLPQSPPTPRQPAYDEAALVRDAKRGDAAAFDDLARAVMPRLLGTARRLVGRGFAAEEVVADALFRAFKHMHTFRAEAGFGAWAHRILVRVVADRFRTRARDRRRRQALIEETLGRTEGAAAPGRPAITQPGPERMIHEERLEQMRAHLATLPPTQRLVLLLHAWEGMGLAQIADVLGMRYATTKSNLHHARKAFRVAFEHGRSAGAVQDTAPRDGGATS